MAWYRTGTASLTNGSTTVTGSGTDWVTGAAVGEGFYGPDGRVYEIAAITSSTGLTLGSSYLGTTASGQTYQIIPSQSYIRDLAAAAAQLVADYAAVATNAGTGKFADGTVSAPGVRFVSDENTGFYRSGTDEVTFVANGVAQFKYSASSGVQFLTTAVDINGGTVDGTVIGATTPEAGTFSALNVTGTTTLSALSASTALHVNASKQITSIANTGTGNNVLSTSPTLVTPALGTPSSGVLTNCTGTASGLTAGNVTTNANLTGPVTSVGNVTSIANGAITNAMLANAAVANLSGTNTGDQTNISGNAATATLAGNASQLLGATWAMPSAIGGTTPAAGSFTALSATTFTQSNRIDSSFTIPDGQNALTIGPFEVSPDVTVTGLGNATWRGL